MKTRPILFALLLSLAMPLMAQLPTPESFIGHPVGADRQLAPYSRVLEYLRLVASRSGRVSIYEAGQSTLGNDMVAMILTSEENQLNLERYREIARRLANPDQLSEDEARALTEEGKVIVLFTFTIHATEVGSTQMSMEFVHDFATTRDPRKMEWMENTILLLMPSINPDGQNLIIDWYNQNLGTEYEGGSMPWLYHHYVGHDNNRDFYMLTQKETRVVNDLLYSRWFPQVFVDEHQMGSTGARMFVPPQTDPLDPEIHSLVFRQADLIGTNMSYRLEEAGKQGVGHNMIFDSYWPGGTRNTAWWKNVTGLLTEVASVQIATPIYVDPSELSGGRKGLPEYKRRSNFPTPWQGGWWRLRDIIDYELIATWAAAETASQYRQEFLESFYRMGSEAARAGADQAPYGWIVHPEQHDPVAAGRLVALLRRHGVRVSVTAEPLEVALTTYPVGTHVISAAQPYRAFLLTMLRRQRYPEVVPYKGGPIYPPYDVTAWSLPELMGVDVVEVETPFSTSDLSLVEEPVWPAVQVEESAAGYLIPHAADSAFVAMNRWLADGVEVHWLLSDVEDGSRGDIYLRPDQLPADELQSLATELHLPIKSLSSPPSGTHLRVRPSRVGLYKPWVASMDEGWTRFLLENYEFPHLNLSNQDIQESSFRGNIDVLLFPDVDESIIRTGQRDPDDNGHRRILLPPAYAGGLGPDGGQAIKSWVESGGTVVGLDDSTAYLIDLFQLPVTNVLDGVDDESFSAPGTLLRIDVDTSHPLGFGLRPQEAAYFAGSAAFQTSVPSARFKRHVVARYPDHRDDIPVSGYIKGADLLARRAAVVELQIGKGRVVLIGFRAQHRAQTLRTFKLLFNSLLLPGLETVELGG
jgi:hypothetical protein